MAPPNEPSSPPPPGDSAERRRSPRFAALVAEQFGGGLYRYLLSRLSHRQAAEDLAQEVYLRLLRFADRELVQSPENYVYRVAFNVLHEFRLHQRRNPVQFDSTTATELESLLPDDAPTAEQLYEQDDREQQLEAVLAKLPAMQRSVFLLAVRHDVPHEEIAARLGISLHTVRKYLYRTLHFCRTQMISQNRTSAK
ncbi:RNA polymerase sigma factor [Steroidobacter sp.]|uniref:RNA polymerase sigma factor n=1 Tax=Steroidobacter sp. TaxID=1978227 RepID=UPI001A39E539|nr:RNA polymerase sigma factor [Steroidobacter sp.]MBL8265640.1 RNA polymerase sigma factor [Steroidobacter sp.]